MVTSSQPVHRIGTSPLTGFTCSLLVLFLSLVHLSSFISLLVVSFLPSHWPNSGFPTCLGLDGCCGRLSCALQHLRPRLTQMLVTLPSMTALNVSRCCQMFPGCTVTSGEQPLARERTWDTPTFLNKTLFQKCSYLFSGSRRQHAFGCLCEVNV